MTLNFRNFSYIYIVSMDRKNGEKILDRKKVTEYSWTPTNTEFREKEI